MNSVANRLSNIILSLIFRYTNALILIFLVAAGVSCFYTIKHLGINSNTAEMFDPSLDFRRSMDRYKQLFPLAEDNFVMVISGPTPELVRSTSDSITEKLENRPDLYASIFQPTGHPFFVRNQLLFLDSANLSRLTTQIGRARPMITFMVENYSLKGLFSFLGLMTRFSSPDQLQGMKAWFQQMDNSLLASGVNNATPMSWQLLMQDSTESGLVTHNFIQVSPIMDYKKVRPSKDAIETAKIIASKYNTDYTKVRITGKKAMTYEEMGSVMDGAIQASVLALVMVSLALWLGLRSIRLIIATLISLVIGLLITAAFSAWAVGQLNMISVAFAVLYIGLGVDYAIHLCLRYRELGMTGTAMQEALRASIKHIVPALVLSTLSTAIGFYAFIPTDFTGVSELGLIAGTGMFISLLVTLLLLPCLIWRLSGLSPFHKRPMAGFILNDLGKYHVPIRYGTILLALVTSIIITRVAFDYDPINLRDPSSESVATARELIDSGEISPWSLNILTHDSANLEGLSNHLKSLPEVSRVLHLKRFVPKNQMAKFPKIDSIRTILEPISSFPDVFDQVSLQDQIKGIEVFGKLLTSPRFETVSYVKDFGNHLIAFKDSVDKLDEENQQKAVLRLQGNLLQTLPYTVNGLLAGINPEPVNVNSLPLDLRKRWVSSEGDYRIQLFPNNGASTIKELRAFMESVQRIAPGATGDLSVTLAAGDTVIKAFKQALIYAIVAIAFLLLVYLQNLKQVLYILSPLLLAGLFTGALTVILGLDFNFANIIAIPVLLGLGVDNGVHIVHRAKSNPGNRPLLETSTARAIFFSSLTTLFSFGNLAFSPHRGTASMGLLLTVGVLFILITTLLILPAFMNGQRAESMEHT